MLTLKIWSLLILLQSPLPIDSTEATLQRMSNDTNKVLFLIDLSWSLRNSIPQQSIEYGQQAYDLSVKLNYKTGITKSLTFVGVAHRNLGNYKQAMICFEQVKLLAQQYNDEDGLAYTYLNMGYLYTLQGNYTVAIQHLLSATKTAERINNKTLLAYCYINMARVFVEQKSYTDALQYHHKALEIRKQMNDTYGVGLSLNEIGSVFLEKQKQAEAIGYYYRSLEIMEKLNAKSDIASNNRDIGSVYWAQQKNDSAFIFYRKALQIYRNMADQNGIATISNFLANFFLSKNDLDSALFYAQTALRISKEINSLKILAEASKNLGVVYAKSGNYQQALFFQKQHNKLSDSLLNIKSAQRILQLEMQYLFEKERKEERIKYLRQESQTRTELDKQKVYRNLFIGGIVILFAFLLLAIYHYTIKYKNHTLLQEQNSQIVQQNSEIQRQSENLLQINSQILLKNNELNRQKNKIEQQNLRLQAANNEISEQKEIIADKNNEIISSMVYAQRIQQAIMPTAETLKDVLKNYFVFYQPKEIIGGDFYWIKQLNHYMLVAVADCTGHGIPGAMMSMLGVSCLNDVVRRGNIETASHILNELRTELKQLLHQTGKANEAKDGMDMALCIINTQNHTLQYAGANNNVILIRQLRNKPVELIELLSDRMPIGVYEREHAFNNKTIQLQINDLLYLYSDGFADQIGYSGKKFKRQRFKSLLMDICHLSLSEQQKQVQHTFENWRSDAEQLDDVLVMGIKIL